MYHFTLFGVSGRPPTFQEREFSLAKQHFLAKSGNLGNRDLVVRVGTEMMDLDNRSEPLLFKAYIAFPDFRASRSHSQVP